jgi:hypothetical protein
MFQAMPTAQGARLDAASFGTGSSLRPSRAEANGRGGRAPRAASDVRRRCSRGRPSRGTPSQGAPVQRQSIIDSGIHSWPLPRRHPVEIENSSSLSRRLQHKRSENDEVVRRRNQRLEGCRYVRVWRLCRTILCTPHFPTRVGRLPERVAWSRGASLHRGRQEPWGAHELSSPCYLRFRNPRCRQPRSGPRRFM